MPRAERGQPPGVFLDPVEHPPPKGERVLLLTQYGMTIMGVWTKNGGYIGWARQPVIPKELREKIR